MIIEQAFLQLPEILHGSGYQQQGYEAGIVGAMSLAILQVLNGHNTINPLSCFQYEKIFRNGGTFEDGNNRTVRYIRADLYVNIRKLLVANRRLAQYGWRHHAWIEAKFLRNQTNNGTAHSTNKSAHCANFLADIIRLSTLIPESAGTTSNGRYFLHVYDSEPKFYLTSRARSWTKSLTALGHQNIKIENLDKEPQTIKKNLGNLKGLKLELSVTNMGLIPIFASHRPCYWMYLTRLDSIQATLGSASFHIQNDRKICKSAPDSLDKIAFFVASNLNIEPNSLETIPPVDLNIADEATDPEHL